MNYDSYLGEIESLIEYIYDFKEMGYIGGLDDISRCYQSLIARIRYNWFFCEGMFYSDIDESVKGNAMEFDALLHKLRTLQSRLNSAKGYSIVDIDVEFDKIENIIIEEIEKAEHFIDIAVAWLTNGRICNALNTTSNKGIRIRILVNDDDINNKNMPNLDSEIKIYKNPSQGVYDNIMHNKFSVFDGNTVITGSYNWTKKAKYNNENIVIIINEEMAKRFTIRFNKMVEEINCNKR